MLELQRPDSLVVRVVSATRAEIESGQLPPESRLPTEQQLAEQLNISRSVENDLKGLAVVLFMAVGSNALSYMFKTFSLAYLTQFKGVGDQGRKHSAFKN